MEYIKGKFKKVIFESTNGSGYKIGLFRVHESSDNIKEACENKTVTFTGYFYDLRIDETYIFHGNYINSNKYN